MTPEIVPVMVDPETLFRMEQSAQLPVVYECKLQGAPCGMHFEGTTSVVSAHLRGQHGIIGPDSAITTCTWGSCRKRLKKGSMARHILTHLGVKVCCSICGIVKCRRDVLRAHIKSSEQCRFASINIIHGPERRFFVPVGLINTHQIL
jgi:hypothetical protein